MATDVERQAAGKNQPPPIKESLKNLKARFAPGVNYVVLIAAIFNLSMLVIGCINVHKCNVSKNIPLFLIATGAIGLMSKFTTFARGRFSKHLQIAYFESALYGAETIFFFLGTYWVYKEYKPSYDPADGEAYCNKTAYLFAFIYITIYYAIAAFVVGILVLKCCCIICGVPCCVCCLIRSVEEANEEEDGETKSDETEAAKPLTTTTESEAKV